MFLKVPTASRIIKILSLVSVVSCLLYLVLTEFSTRPNAKKIVPIHFPAAGYEQPHSHMQMVQPFEAVIPEKYNEAAVKSRLINEKIKRLSGMVIQPDVMPVSNRTDIGINYNIHIFYYCPVSWWTPDNTSGSANHSDESLNIVFYPELGIYNCSEQIIEKHFKQINKTGIGVVLFSWSLNQTSSDLMAIMFNVAQAYKIKISFVLENYPGRSVERIRDQIKYIIDKYSQYESFNRIYDNERKRLLPVFYLKDTYNSGIEESSWRGLLGNKQSESVRNTKYDAIFLNHVVTKDTLGATKRSLFDGFFTYSASNGNTYASTWKNWQHISQFASQYKMLFIPSLGPGYMEKVWKHQRNQKQKHQSCRHRSNGNYYGVGWRTAMQLENDKFISISSFNNWVEGTQIEPAVTRWNFRDYSHRSTNYSSTKYMDLTRYWIGEFADRKKVDPNQHFCHTWTNDTKPDPKSSILRGRIHTKNNN